MTSPSNSDSATKDRNPFWMRSVSFAILHRILCLVAEHSHGLRPIEVNRLITDHRILHGRRPDLPPSLTTLYHYRTILLRLQLFRRRGPRLCVNIADPIVASLLQEPLPEISNRSLTVRIKELFSNLVLRNRDCASLFFDAFVPHSSFPYTASQFRRSATPVVYSLHASGQSVRVLLKNTHNDYIKTLTATRARTRKGPPPLVQAVPYGIRYWARNELNLIDEYWRAPDRCVAMFPLAMPPNAHSHNTLLRQTANHILSLRGATDWTLFSVYDLLTQSCEILRQPISILFQAIDLLIRHWKQYIILIPIPKTLATTAAHNTHHEQILLRNYYRSSNSRGPYISHLRIHSAIPLYRVAQSNHICSDMSARLR